VEPGVLLGENTREVIAIERCAQHLRDRGQQRVLLREEGTVLGVHDVELPRHAIARRERDAQRPRTRRIPGAREYLAVEEQARGRDLRELHRGRQHVDQRTHASVVGPTVVQQQRGRAMQRGQLLDALAEVMDHLALFGTVVPAHVHRGRYLTARSIRSELVDHPIDATVAGR
jgi:hypothetical protein